MQGIACGQDIAQSSRANVIDVVLALGWIGIQGLNNLFLNLLFSLIKARSADFLLFKRNQLLTVGSGTEALNPCIVQAGPVHSSPDLIVVWRLGKFHPNLGPALEINPQRNAVPEKHGKQSSHAENQRKAKEVPFPAQKIYFSIAKKFHFARFLKNDQILKASPRCLRARMASKITRETNTAVNRLAKRPNVSVTANPLTGPDPKRNRMAAETMVVTCVSTMVTHACAKPWSTAAGGGLPARRPWRRRAGIRRGA